MVEKDHNIQNMSQETAVLNNRKRVSNKNCNNNHNTAATPPLQKENSAADDESSVRNDQVLEETKQVVRRFLERSLSQNAKSSMPFMKPEGYHRLKRDGKLAYYQRQQSKPEQGNLVRRDSSSRVSHSPNRRENAALPSRPSLNELTSESKKNSQLTLAGQDQTQFKSETDVRTLRKCVEPQQNEDVPDGSLIMRLIESETSVSSGTFQSSDSLPSTSDDGSNHPLRRQSFSKAVSRKSVISFIESKKKARVSLSEEPKVHEKTGGKSSVKDHINEVQDKEMDGKNSLYCDEPSCVSSQTHSHKNLDYAMMRGEDRQTVEKKPSFREKMRKIMASTSNKKKLKYKKSFEQPKFEEEETLRSSENRSLSAGARTVFSPEVEFSRVTERKTHSATAATSYNVGREPSKQSSSSKHKTSSTERSSSPTKSKSQHTPHIFRSMSVRNKFSPKPRRHPIHHSGSSNSLSLDPPTTAAVGGQLERNKSGSLPLSVRYGVDQQVYAAKERRYSEDLHATTTRIHEKHTSKKRSPSPSASPPRPQHLDLGSKKKSAGKLKRFLRLFRRRHASESSTGSSRSQSLPSIPAAMEQEDEFKETEDVLTKSLDTEHHDDDLPALSSSEKPQKPYHHRGSLSFSSGDLDGLDDAEKRKIIDEIADTLSRLSAKYNRHIQSRSSTPGSRLATPDSSFSTYDFRQHGRQSRSGPPSRQSSRSDKGPVHPIGKSFRMYKDENQPALAAFLNLRNQGKANESRLERHEGKLARKSPLRRHTHHAQTGSLDSPYHHAPKHRRDLDGISHLPPVESSPTSPKDVVDGMLQSRTPSKSPSPVRSEWEVDACDGDVPSSIKPESSRLPDDSWVTEDHSFVSSQHGSDVDFPSTYLPAEFECHCEEEPQPSTSAIDEDDGSPSSSEIIDEDKLVDLLVEALCKKGDEYVSQVDMPNGLPIEPVIRSSMIRYMKRVTYEHFSHFAFRFCQNLKQLVDTGPTRHPEIFPVVMVFNMTQLIVNMARSDRAGHAVHHVLHLSTQLVTDIVQHTGNTWGILLEQLQDTEEELSASETPEDSPRRQPNTDDELD